MNTSKIIKVAAAVAVALLTFSCEKPFVTELELSDSVANFNAEGGSVNINVSSNADWTVSKDADWFSTNLVGDALTITVSANEGFDVRTANVTVSANELSRVVKITQLASTPSLAIDIEEMAMDAEGGNFTIEVTSNAPWTVETVDEWVSAGPSEGNGNASISVVVAANPEFSARTSTITVKESVNGKAFTVKVEQDRAPYNRQSDSLALVAIYNASNGAEWAKNKWDLSAPINEWKGVKLENNRVVELAVPVNSISKEWNIPDDIANLDELVKLSFNKNSVAGEIPAAIYKLGKLEKLDLSNCKLSGSLSAELGNLEMLTEINLLNNSNLGGGIPAEIGKLKKLFRVNLSSTSISGAIPAELTGCESLQEFMVFNAKLSGELPDIWDQFKNNFKILMIYGNEGLTGHLPSSLGNIVSTQSSISYHLYNCNFTGNIPETFANLPVGLKQLRIQGNKLEGEVPAAVKAHANWNTWKPDQYIFPQQEGYGLR
ncbi:MAG: BACON domain-containing carbohydrate-binding protein [Bacteroidales bacterium]|nr:BACON domain-containing carbohydrate-binding protein [Bacteroidales bacterium]